MHTNSYSTILLTITESVNESKSLHNGELMNSKISQKNCPFTATIEIAGKVETDILLKMCYFLEFFLASPSIIKIRVEYIKCDVQWTHKKCK